MKIPEHIRLTIDTLLQPCGTSLAELSHGHQAELKEYALSVSEVSKRYAISRYKLFRLRKAGSIESIKLDRARGGKVLIVLSSLNRYLAACRQMTNCA